MILVTITIFNVNFYIHVTHIPSWDALTLFKMDLNSLDIQHEYYISNLNDKIVNCLLSVAQTFILLLLNCYSNICTRLLQPNALACRVQTFLFRRGLNFSLR